MLAKIYLYTWLAIAAAFLIFLIAGSMSVMTLIVFGFIAFGMIFMGMIAVLPIAVSHPAQKTEARTIKASSQPVIAPIPNGAHSLRA